MGGRDVTFISKPSSRIDIITKFQPLTAIDMEKNMRDKLIKTIGLINSYGLAPSMS